MGRPLHVVTPFFGEACAYLVTEIMWPSLHRHSLLGNLDPSTVHHRVYCRGHDAEAHLPVHRIKLKQHGYNCRIDTDVMPNLPIPLGDVGVRNRYDLRHVHLVKCVLDAMEKAIVDNAIMLLAPPDLLFGYGLSNVLTKFKKGDYWVCGHVRISLEHSYIAARDRLLSGGFGDNGELVDFCFRDHPHSMTAHGIKYPDVYWRAKDNGDHYSVWFRDPIPSVIDPTVDLIKFWRSGGLTNDPARTGFEMLDHDLVAYALREDSLKCVTDSNDLFIAELTPDGDHVPPKFDPDVKPGTGCTEDLFQNMELKFWKEWHG